MANVTRYKTSKGETRYRVRYRKPDGAQTDKRGFKRKIDAENWEVWKLPSTSLPNGK